MTDTQRKNFLGIPISGEINTNYGRAVEQYPREQFEEVVRNLLDDPFIVEFGWVQYTPYFNDGEPCVFGASGVWVRTEVDPGLRTDPDQEEDDWEERERLEIGYGIHPTLGGWEWTNGYGSTQVYVGEREAQRKLAEALDSAVDGGHFNDVLVDLFGDHCQVTVSRTGITVDEYSHD